jgi:hypothetical protein
MDRDYDLSSGRSIAKLIGINDYLARMALV